MLPKFDIVFLDMNDVLLDWMTPATEAHDFPLAKLISHGRWKAGDGRNVYEIMGMTKFKFWEKIDALASFWWDLKKSPVFDEIIKIARSIGGDVQILTKPHQHEKCFAGKQAWCAKNLPGMKMTLTEDKALLARAGRLLIDDRDENCDAFRAAGGGSAILFPQHWNSAHDKAPFGPLFYLAQELRKLAEEQREAVENQEPCYWDAGAEVWRRVSDDKVHPKQGPRNPGWPDSVTPYQSCSSKNRVPEICTVKIDGKHKPISGPPSIMGLNEFGPGTNTGHGHAWNRPDGSFAKCFGIRACPECQREADWLKAQIAAGEFPDVLYGRGVDDPLIRGTFVEPTPLLPSPSQHSGNITERILNGLEGAAENIITKTRHPLADEFQQAKSHESSVAELSN